MINNGYWMIEDIAKPQWLGIHEDNDFIWTDNNNALRFDNRKSAEDLLGALKGSGADVDGALKDSIVTDHVDSMETE